MSTPRAPFPLVDSDVARDTDEPRRTHAAGRALGGRAGCRLAVALAIVSVLALGLAQNVRIEVGDDPREVVSSAPAGSTFVFASGVHRMTEMIVPRHGDVFRGEDGAVLNGSLLLRDRDFTRSEGLWAVDVVPRTDSTAGDCEASRPRCHYAVDLFLDDEPLRHVERRAMVGPGSWYLDFETGVAYMADLPLGRTVEFAVGTTAISGSANAVTVENLVIEKFANPAQKGAVNAFNWSDPDSPGHSWSIRGNTIRLNHGVGVAASFGARIVDNRILDNGELGILSVNGADTWIEGNEIARNNHAGFRLHWESGGGKFIRTRRLTLRDNHVHGNFGPGLWADMDNIDTLYAENLVEYNQTTGIFHETSYEAVIRDNVVRYNGTEIGLESYAYVFGSGILVFNSPDVEVVRNVVVGNWNGINGLHQDRGMGLYGQHDLRNLLVRDNVIHMGYHESGMGPNDPAGEGSGMQAVSGVSQAGGFNVVYSRTFNNRFENNHYLIEDQSLSHWTWDNRRVEFEAWSNCAYAYEQWTECRQDQRSIVEIVDGPEEALRLAEVRED